MQFLLSLQIIVSLNFRVSLQILELVVSSSWNESSPGNCVSYWIERCLSGGLTGKLSEEGVLLRH